MTEKKLRDMDWIFETEDWTKREEKLIKFLMDKFLEVVLHEYPFISKKKFAEFHEDFDDAYLKIYYGSGSQIEKNINKSIIIK